MHVQDRAVNGPRGATQMALHAWTHLGFVGETDAACLVVAQRHHIQRRAVQFLFSIPFPLLNWPAEYLSQTRTYFGLLLLLQSARILLHSASILPQPARLLDGNRVRIVWAVACLPRELVHERHTAKESRRRLVAYGSSLSFAIPCCRYCRQTRLLHVRERVVVVCTVGIRTRFSCGSLHEGNPLA